MENVIFVTFGSEYIQPSKTQPWMLEIQVIYHDFPYKKPKIYKQLYKKLAFYTVRQKPSKIQFGKLYIWDCMENHRILPGFPSSYNLKKHTISKKMKNCAEIVRPKTR